MVLINTLVDGLTYYKNKYFAELYVHMYIWLIPGCCKLAKI